MSDIGDEVFFRIGGILHESRMKECYGNIQISSRRKWPETFKEFRRQRHDGQPWIDVAIAQVRALIKAGTPNNIGHTIHAAYNFWRDKGDDARSGGAVANAFIAGYEAALLAQRIEHDPSKVGIEDLTPSERTKIGT